MDHLKTVRVSFYNSSTGRFQGEQGLLTRTTLQFHDPTGRLGRLERKQKRIQQKRSEAIQGALITNGFRQRRFFSRHWRLEKKEQRLLRKAQAAVDRALQWHPGRIGLMMSGHTGTEPFLHVEYAHQANDLRDELRSSKDFYFQTL